MKPEPEDRDPKTWVDTRTAAAHLGLHPDTLRHMRERGGGPAYARFGRAVRYQLCELDRWASERTYRSTAEELANG